MSILICPECGEGPLRWKDLDRRGLEYATMVCQKCGAEYLGIPGWHIEKRKWKNK